MQWWIMRDCALHAVVFGSVCQQDGVMFNDKWTGENKIKHLQFVIPVSSTFFSAFFVFILKKSLVEQAFSLQN